METIIVNVDGQNLNATHFVGLGDTEGPARIIADGISEDKTWAQKAYDACKKEIAKQAKVK
jgi:hypothetical protein